MTLSLAKKLENDLYSRRCEEEPKQHYSVRMGGRSMFLEGEDLGF
jgi:hypothetical protein